MRTDAPTRAAVSPGRCCAIATLLICASMARAAQQPATWLGGPGQWTDPSKWSTGVVPANSPSDSYLVNIDAGNPLASTTTLTSTTDQTPISIDALTVDAADTLSLDGRILNVNGPLTVNGTVEVRTHDDSLIPASSLTVNSPDGITGSGTLRFGTPVPSRSVTTSQS
jgi:hypothetical protein